MFYVYLIFLETRPIYVGKGKGNRYLVSVKHLENKFKRDLPVVILRDNLSEEDAFSLERLFIKVIGRADRLEGPLLNRTDGGDGISGALRSEETRKLLSKKLKGKKRTLEQRNNISRAQILWRQNNTESDESRLKRRTSHLGIKRPEVGRKISATLKKRGIRPSEEATQRSIEVRLGKPSPLRGVPKNRESVEKQAAKLRGRVGQNKGRKWWTTPDNACYMAFEPRDKSDRPGSAFCWWSTPEGSSYKAISPRSDCDVKGRKSFTRVGEQ